MGSFSANIIKLSVNARTVCMCVCVLGVIVRVCGAKSCNVFTAHTREEGRKLVEEALKG